MKVALCTETLYPLHGGVERRCYEVSKRLMKKGIDVKIYTASGKSARKIRDAPLRHAHGFEIRQVGHPTIRKPPKRNYACCIEYWLRLFSSLLRSEADIIDANGHMSLMPAALAGLAKRMPVVATVHDLYSSQWHSMYGGIASIGGAAFEALSVKMPFSHMMTVNRALKEKIAEVFRIPEEKISIVPNGIDVNHFRRIKAKKDGSIIYVGRLVPQKNLAMLLRAFALSGIDAELKIIGSGSDEARLKKLAAELGIGRRVVFFGTVENHDDVLAEIKKSCLFVLPSLRESFGITVLEAMACRTPVLSTPTEGPKDIITHGKNGFLAGNEHEIAEGIRKITESSRLRNRIAAAGVRTAEKDDWDIITKQVIGVYESVIA